MSAPRILHIVGRGAAVAALLVGLTACDPASEDAAPDSGGPAPSSAAPPASEDPGFGGFDMDAVPETAPLTGEFPYFSIPDGYVNPNQDIPIDDYGKLPLWTGSGLEWVEGTVYQSVIFAADGENFSSIELKKLVDDMLTAAGAVQVADSKMSEQAIAEIDDETQVTYVDGLGDIYNDDTVTYLIKTPEQTVWVHLCSSSASAGWFVVEAQ